MKHRSKACSQQPPWVNAHTHLQSRRMRLNVGRVLVLNNPPALTKQRPTPLKHPTSSGRSAISVPVRSGAG